MSVNLSPKCFKTIVKPFLYTNFDYGLLRLPNLDYWLPVDVAGQKGMLTPPRHLASHINLVWGFFFARNSAIRYYCDPLRLPKIFHCRV